MNKDQLKFVVFSPLIMAAEMLSAASDFIVNYRKYWNCLKDTKK